MKIKRMADFNKRLVVSLLVGGLFAVLIAFSESRWAAICMVLSAALLSVVGTWEYIQLALAKDLRPAGRLMMGLSFALVLTFFYAQKFPQYSQLPLAIFVIGVVSFFIFHFKDTRDALIHVAVEFFGVIYVALPICFMLGVLYPVTSHLHRARWKMVALLSHRRHQNHRHGRLFCR